MKIIRYLKDVLSFNKNAEQKVLEYIIVNKEHAKLGYAWKPADIKQWDGYHCPTCSKKILDKDGIPVNYDYLKRNKRYCKRAKNS